MPRRSTFTVLLAVVLVLTTSANPQASEVDVTGLGEPDELLREDGRPGSGHGLAPQLALSSAPAAGVRRGT